MVVNEFTLATLTRHYLNWYTVVLIAKFRNQNLLGSLSAFDVKQSAGRSCAVSKTLIPFTSSDNFQLDLSISGIKYHFRVLTLFQEPNSRTFIS